MRLVCLAMSKRRAKVEIGRATSGRVSAGNNEVTVNIPVKAAHCVSSSQAGIFDPRGAMASEMRGKLLAMRSPFGGRLSCG